VLAAVGEGAGRGGAKTREEQAFVSARLQALGAFMSAVDAGISTFTQGKTVDAEAMQNVIPLLSPRAQQKK